MMKSVEEHKRMKMSQWMTVLKYQQEWKIM